MALADTLFLRQMQAKARDAQRREQRLASHDEQMRRFYETSGRVMRDAAAANASQAQVDQAKAERTAALESTAGTKRTEYEDPRADRIAREAYQAIQLKKAAAAAQAQAKEETYGRHKMFEGRLGEASKILGREATASEGLLDRASRERIAGMKADAAGKGKRAMTPSEWLAAVTDEKDSIEKRIALDLKKIFNDNPEVAAAGTKAVQRYGKVINEGRAKGWTPEQVFKRWEESSEAQTYRRETGFTPGQTSTGGSGGTQDTPTKKKWTMSRVKHPTRPDVALALVRPTSPGMTARSEEFNTYTRALEALAMEQNNGIVTIPSSLSSVLKQKLKIFLEGRPGIVEVVEVEDAP